MAPFTTDSQAVVKLMNDAICAARMSAETRQGAGHTGELLGGDPGDRSPTLPAARGARAVSTWLLPGGAALTRGAVREGTGRVRLLSALPLRSVTGTPQTFIDSFMLQKYL